MYFVQTKFSYERYEVLPWQKYRIGIHSDISIRANANESEVGMIRINSDWKFGLDQSELGFIRIENLVSDWFGMIRIGSDTDIGIVLIVSEWIPIRYFRRVINYRRGSYIRHNTSHMDSDKAVSQWRC